jgi:hypothetical protein
LDISMLKDPTRVDLGHEQACSVLTSLLGSPGRHEPNKQHRTGEVRVVKLTKVVDTLGPNSDETQKTERALPETLSDASPSFDTSEVTGSVARTYRYHRITPQRYYVWLSRDEELGAAGMPDPPRGRMCGPLGDSKGCGWQSSREFILASLSRGS